MLRTLVLAAGLIAFGVNAHARCRHQPFDNRSWKVQVTPQYGCETNIDVITFSSGKMTSTWLTSLGYQPVSCDIDHNSFEGRFVRGDLHIRYKGKWKHEALKGEVRLTTPHSDTLRRWRLADAVALAHAPVETTPAASEVEPPPPPPAH
jgi:hypothetical protein